MGNLLQFYKVYTTLHTFFLEWQTKNNYNDNDNEATSTLVKWQDQFGKLSHQQWYSISSVVQQAISSINYFLRMSNDENVFIKCDKTLHNSYI